MDVGDPSNFARIYDLYKGDHDAIAAYIGGATYKDQYKSNIEDVYDYIIMTLKKAIELHGSVHRNYCLKCGKSYSAEDILKSEGVPHCECGGIIKPDVVLYGENLDDRTVTGALAAIESCDTLIIGGTSLTVYPAAGFIRYFGGRNLVLINMSATPYDSRADLAIHDKVGEVLDKINVN